MIRKILAVLLGVMTAFALVALIDWLGHIVYPVPETLDVNDTAQMAKHIRDLPVGAFAFVLGAWGLATLAGGLVTCAIMKEKPLLYASLIGLVVLAATIANLVKIPHPTWFSITAVGVIAVATILAAALSTRR